MTRVIGDVHGQLTKLRALLQEGGLTDTEGHWTGGEERLWFLGDYMDRGPDGVGVIELIMRLQGEAAAAGGEVGALLGNHEVQLLAALYAPDHFSKGPGGTFRQAWLRNGGIEPELGRLTSEHVGWLESLPAMAQVEHSLLIHADTTLYQEYGSSIAEVNRALSDLLLQRDMAALDLLLERFSRRDAFRDNQSTAEAMLDIFGGRQIAHGHSPIMRLTRQSAASVTGPLLYAGGLCVNVDGGMYLGGPGFLSPLTPMV